MSLTLENLRLATALVHAVPRAELRLSCDGGRRLVVSSHPAADIGICAFRRAVLASACPARPDCSEWIDDAVVGGSLTPVGGGAYLGDDGPRERRWFATLLRPEHVCDLLEALEVDGMADGAMTARLAPDPGLGVTIVSTAVDPAWPDHLGAEVATMALQACLVEELVVDTHTRGRRTGARERARAPRRTNAAIRTDGTERRPPA